MSTRKSIWFVIGLLVVMSMVLAACASQLQEYFAGKRRHFELPLSPAGTAFREC